MAFVGVVTADYIPALGQPSGFPYLTVDDFPMSWASNACGVDSDRRQDERRPSLRHAIEREWLVCISLLVLFLLVARRPSSLFTVVVPLVLSSYPIVR